MTVHQPTTSRRAILAGVAALATGASVNAAAIVGAKAMQSDPILAAIEAHRAAFMHQMETGWTQGGLPDYSPEWVIATREDDAAREVERAAQLALIQIRPTTLAGILALLSYVDDFSIGALVSPAGTGCRSDADYLWPPNLDDARINHDDDAAEPLSFHFWLMRNIREALATVRS
jgi:hypothetical protein